MTATSSGVYPLSAAIYSRVSANGMVIVRVVSIITSDELELNQDGDSCC